MKYTIYIKPTNRCNLKCSHCYNAIVPSMQDMADATLQNAIKSILNFSKDHKADQIDIQFHGGEPMMYDVEKLHWMLSQLETEGNLKFCITTNLVYGLVEKHIQFFQRMKPYDENPVIMTSWDKKIRFANSAQEDLWKKNVKTLIQSGIAVQPIVCITKELVCENPSSVFQIMQHLGIKTMNFERITKTGRAKECDIAPSNADVDHWLHLAWKTHREYDLHVPLFDSIEQSCRGFLIGCRARQCMKTVITINPDGSVAACPNTANNIIGTVTANGFQFNERREMQCKFEETIHKKCYICKYFRYCNGDCCQLSYDQSGCPGLVSIYKEILG